MKHLKSFLTCKKGTPISENSPCPFLKAYIKAKRALSASSEVAWTTATVACTHCYLAIAVRMTVGLHRVSRTRGVSHLAVCIEADIATVVSTLVGHVHRGTSIVEMASLVVSVHCERPCTSLPGYRTIEVWESHILVVLPAVQDIAEVSVTAIPPDALSCSRCKVRHFSADLQRINPKLKGCFT